MTADQLATYLTQTVGRANGAYVARLTNGVVTLVRVTR